MSEEKCLLQVENLNVYYGSIHAIKGISFHVNEGEIVTLIGANGAGKSTTLNTIAGLLKPKSGTVTFDGKMISGFPANRIHGPCAHSGRSDLPDHSGASCFRHHHSSGGAERPEGAPDRKPCLRAGNRCNHPQRNRRGAGKFSRRKKSIPRRLILPDFSFFFFTPCIHWCRG